MVELTMLDELLEVLDRHTDDRDDSWQSMWQDMKTEVRSGTCELRIFRDMQIDGGVCFSVTDNQTVKGESNGQA